MGTMGGQLRVRVASECWDMGDQVLGGGTSESGE